MTPRFFRKGSSGNPSKQPPTSPLNDIPTDSVPVTCSIFDVMVAPNLYGDILSYV